jgi:hypothetical protein
MPLTCDCFPAILAFRESLSILLPEYHRGLRLVSVQSESSLESPSILYIRRQGVFLVCSSWYSGDIGVLVLVIKAIKTKPMPIVLDLVTSDRDFVRDGV